MNKCEQVKCVEVLKDKSGNTVGYRLSDGIKEKDIESYVL